MQAIFHLSLAIYVSKVVKIETRGDQKMQKNTTVRSDFLGILTALLDLLRDLVKNALFFWKSQLTPINIY